MKQASGRDSSWCTCGVSRLVLSLCLSCLAIAFSPAVQGAQVGQSNSVQGSSGVEKKLLAPPVFSVPSGIYTNSILVRLSADGSAAVVRYTLDGSEPRETSSAFLESLRLTGTTLVKAKAFAPGSLPSATCCHTYVLLDESLLGFSSNLPLVILQTFQGYVSRDTPLPVSARFIQNSSGRAFPSGPADFDGRGTLKFRGRSSLDYPKRSFAFHARDDLEHSVKVPLLGLPSDSEWVLYAPYPDKTLMRDVLAYELSNKMGRYAPRTKFVELFVSRSGEKLSARSYCGVYVLEEKIKRAKHRVNIQKLGPMDNAEPAISGGYIFRKDHGDKGQPRFYTARGNPFYYVEPKAANLTPAQKGWLTHYLDQLEGALYGPNFRDPQRGYAAFLDADSMIDHHWIVEMSKNVDGIRFSNFLHKDRGGKVKMEPIWDWNLSFGNASGKQGWAPDGWYWAQLHDAEYLWFGRLFEDPDFMQKYIDRWGVLRTNVFSPATILARVDELAALLREAQGRNFRRWPILGRYVHPNYYVGSSYDEEVRWMKQWIQSRLAWIDRQFLPAPSFSLREGRIEPGASLSMKTPAGKIYYTLDGTDPRLPGGRVSPKARAYNAPITVQEDAHVLARAYQGNVWSSPAASVLTIRTRAASH